MSDSILGLDIGEDSVKAVLVARSLKGGGRITGSSIISIREAGGLSGALEKLFENPDYRGCHCIAALPAKNIAFRNISLPFRNEKKIRQTITFALEPLIHYSIDDALIDYVVVKTAEKSEIFAAVVPKAVVRERLELLGPAVKKVEALDVDGVTVASRLFAEAPAAGCDLVLDIGARQTVAAFVSQGRLIQVRGFEFGGHPVTEALAGAWGTDPGEAERKKREGQSDPAAAAVPVCERFFGELKKTVDYLLWQGHLEQGISRILMTGGGALYKPLQEGLSRTFSLPASLVDLADSAGIAMDAAVRNQWRPVIMNQALALAVRGSKKGVGFRFGEGDSKVKAAYLRLKGNLRWAAAIALVLILFGVANIFLDYRSMQIRQARLKAEIAALFKMYNPQATRIVDPVSQMKSGIMEARKISQGMDESRSGITVLAVLRDISALAPTGTELLLSSFILENDVVLIKGQAKNFDAVEMIKRELARSPYFKTVTIGATNLLKQGDKVEFDMQMTLKR